MAKRLSIEVPDAFAWSETEVREMLAAHLYEHALLSLGHAADLAGLDKRTFAERLGKYGVSLFNHPPEDLERDLKNLRGHHR
ncbi:MAG: UPF0175 family protein [Flavobacteriales bacterium]|nr:UPF0175 family protein [Flavobacteriales bacterium]